MPRQMDIMNPTLIVTVPSHECLPKSFFSSIDAATRLIQGQENNVLTFILNSNNNDSSSVHKHNTHHSWQNHNLLLDEGIIKTMEIEKINQKLTNGWNVQAMSCIICCEHTQFVL